MREDTGKIIRERIDLAERNGGKLYLGGLGLQALPDEVLAIAQLRVVDLRDNGLTAFPFDWRGLAQVEELDLSGNALAMVPKALRGCKTLRVLKLSGNRLTSLSLDLELPKGLSELEVDRNNLQMISGLGRPLKLRRLSANENAVEAVLLADKVERSQLTGISLDGNRLSDLPEGMQALPRLYALNLNRNQLCELPACVAEMKALAYLRASSNQLTHLGWTGDRLPTRLRELWLESNCLASLPDCLPRLTELERLHLDSNPLSELPALPVSLQNLSARACRLESLPQSQQFPRLERLDLSANGVAGTLTLELPARLKAIHLSNNRLTGLHLVVPEGAALEEFSAFSNQIEQLTAEGMLGNLRMIDFSDNHLATFPDFFSQSRYLTRVYLAGNLLEEIPYGLRGIPLLKTLVLSQNRIRLVPDWIAQMSWPNCLWLHDNPLEYVSAEVLHGGWVALIFHGTAFAASTKPSMIRPWLTPKLLTREALTGSLPGQCWKDRLWVETKGSHFSPYEWLLTLRSTATSYSVNVAYLSDIRVAQTGLLIERYIGEKIAFLPIGPLNPEEQKELLEFLCPYYQASYLSQLMDPQDTDVGPGGLGFLDDFNLLNSEEYQNAYSVSKFLEGRD